MCFCRSARPGSARMAAIVSGLAVAGLEDAGPDVELFGRDLQPLGDLLQDLRRRFAQTAFDLRQVRVGDAGQRGQLPHRNLGLHALLADELADRTDQLGRLADGTTRLACSLNPSTITVTSVPVSASNCKHRASSRKQAHTRVRARRSRAGRSCTSARGRNALSRRTDSLGCGSTRRVANSTVTVRYPPSRP